jgi:hypothetical protein
VPAGGFEGQTSFTGARDAEEAFESFRFSREFDAETFKHCRASLSPARLSCVQRIDTSRSRATISTGVAANVSRLAVGADVRVR